MRPYFALLLLAACGPRVPVIPGPLAVVREVPPIGTRPDTYRPPPVRPPASPPRTPPTTARRPTTPPPAVVRPVHVPSPVSFADRMAAEAESLVHHGGADDFRDDCSGFVCAASDRAGLPLRGNTERLWALVTELNADHKRKRPALGDLVFFDQTYDRNHNGRLDDELSHVGIVVRIEEDGTLIVAHRGSQGRTTLRMNLLAPHEHTSAGGVVLNDFLRQRTTRDKRGTHYLAGELFRAFATVRDKDLAAWADALTR